MQIKGLKDEDYINYLKPCMFIIASSCTFKCDKENGCNLCQNSHLAQIPKIIVEASDIIERYLNNPLTEAIVWGGLEPFDSFEEMYDFIFQLRNCYLNDDDVVIYTGYNKNEIINEIQALQKFKNIIVKFGRFVPNQEKHYDKILGVQLASENQYAERIS